MHDWLYTVRFSSHERQEKEISSQVKHLKSCLQHLPTEVTEKFCWHSKQPLFELHDLQC